MSDQTKIDALKQAIRRANRICVFSGAGISCPSGIPDFRSADGLYNQQGTGQYSPEEIISHSFFAAHPDLFYSFYRSKMLYPGAKPNAAHLFFASLERAGKQVSVVTQNIDGLHTAAGNSRVMELHGSVLRNYCTCCGKKINVDFVAECDGVPRCPDDGGIIKPDVVLYEEPLDQSVVNQAAQAISRAELMFVVGTSLTVYPAAGFVRYFRGDTLVFINKSATQFDSSADITFNADVVQVTEALAGWQE